MKSKTDCFRGFLAGKPGWMRRVLFALLLYTGWASAWADLQFDVFPGYGNYTRVGAWFPISCEVSHDSPGFQAVVEVTPLNFSQGESYLFPVELPTNTRKRFSIPVFQGGRQTGLRVRLLDPNGKTLAEHEISQIVNLEHETPLLGVMPANFSGAPTYPTSKLSMETLRPRTARLMPEFFPNQALLLEPLTALYLESSRAITLDSEQVEALKGWLFSGGHLILSTENPSEIKSVPWLRELCPANLGNLTRNSGGIALQNWLVMPDNGMSFGGLGRFFPISVSKGSAYQDLKADGTFQNQEIPLLEARPKSGAKVLVSHASQPFILQRAAGQGLVTFLTFSTEREPFKSWSHRELFWAKLTQVPEVLFTTESVNVYGGQSSDAVFGSMLDSRQVKKLPIKWLLAILGLYLVMIGPVDYYWLKRIQRQSLTWITFPLYVIGFSTLIYYIGYRLRAGELEFNQLHWVDVYSKPTGNGAMLKGHSFGSLYSPRNDVYDFDGRGEGAIRLEYEGNMGQNSGGGKFSVSFRDDGFSCNAFVPVWSSRLLTQDWILDSDRPIQVEVSKTSDSELTVNLVNRLNRNLGPVWVIWKDRMVEVPQLAVGTSAVEVRIGDGQGSSLRAMVQNQANVFQAVVNSRRNSLGDSGAGFLDLIPQNSVALSFLQMTQFSQEWSAESSYMERGFVLPQGLDLSGSSERGDLIVLAWDAGHSPIGDTEKFKAPRSSDNTFIRMVIPEGQWQ